MERGEAIGLRSTCQLFSAWPTELSELQRFWLELLCSLSASWRLGGGRWKREAAIVEIVRAVEHATGHDGARTAALAQGSALCRAAVARDATRGRRSGVLSAVDGPAQAVVHHGAAVAHLLGFFDLE